LGSVKTVSDPDTKPTLWFVRHGESTWNASGLVQGQAEGPVLTAKGRREAAQVAERVDGRAITAIYTSDLERAHETAAIIGHALRMPLQYDSALRERNFGVAQGGPLHALSPAASGIERGRVVDADARPRGGESLAEMYERVRGFFTEVGRRAPAGDVLVVTHGGVIRIAQALSAGAGVENMAWGEVVNASVWGFTLPLPSVTAVQSKEAVRSV
jgi:broad specificity phosphatase PhoE